MSKTMKVVLIVTCVVLVCLIGAGIVAGVYYAGMGGRSNFFDIFSGSRVAVDESHALDLNGISEISVECASAAVTVVPGDEPKAEMKGNLWAPKKQDAYLSVTQQGEELSIRFDQPVTFFNWSDVDITVYLPEDCGLNLKVSCASGDTAIRQLALGDISVICASGNTGISSCTGKSVGIEAASGNTNVAECAFDGIRTICQSGNIGIRDTKSAVSVKCTSGKVVLKDVEGALDIGSTSGSVEVSLSQPQISPIDIDLTSGGIRMYLNAQAAFDLDANTTSGGIQCDFDRTVSGGESGSIVGDHIVGKCNGGGSSVTLSTISGGIDIRKQ